MVCIFWGHHTHSGMEANISYVCLIEVKHPLAEKQFSADLDALKWADTCVLVLPCGRSAHTEAGWMAGAGKKVVV